MDTSGIIVLGVLVVLFFFGCFALFMSYKTWNIFHVIASFFVIIALIGFMILAALVLKTHQEWRSVYNKTLADLTTAKATEKRLLEGDPAGASAEDQRSLNSLKSELRQALADRGRVWPECAARLDPAAGVILNVIPASMTPPPATVSHQIKKDMVLYAFKDLRLIEGGEALPSFYLGEFKVINAVENSADITLAPISPLDQTQLNQAQQAGTWTLYEIMPVDSHHVFAVNDLVDNVDGKTAMFGAMMPADEIKKYVPNSLGLPAEKYEQLIASYARDGQRAAQETDPPEDTWMKVRFLKEHKIEVDSETALTPFENDNFDLTGGALRAELRHGVEGGITFEAGDYGFFPRDLEPDPTSGRYAEGSAEQLLQDNIVAQDEAEPLVYVRPLNDYEHRYHEIFRRYARLQQDEARLNEQIAVIGTANTQTQTQTDARQAEFAKLDKDRTGFREEAAAITAYHQKLAADEAKLKADLSTLYRTNIALAEELTSLQQSMAEDINRRTGAVAVGP
jgi:hypothetical protein